MAEPRPAEGAAVPPWLRRHHLLWIAARHRASAIAAIGGGAASLAHWFDRGWPVVVRQQPAPGAGGANASRVAVGIPLPPDLGKLRIAFAVEREWIAASAPPPHLRDLIPLLPAARRDALTRLVRAADEHGLALRVYGSAAWEALTGCSYLTGQSDIDLVWRPSTREQLAASMAMFARWEAESGIRVDGEVLFGDDDAVAWREWQRLARSRDRNTVRVLVKAIGGSRLEAQSALAVRLQQSETCQSVGAAVRD